jgi:hypothetical protein
VLVRSICERLVNAALLAAAGSSWPTTRLQSPLLHFRTKLQRFFLNFFTKEIRTDNVILFGIRKLDKVQTEGNTFLPSVKISSTSAVII